VIARTADGRAFRILTVLDEYSRECLSMRVARRITSQDFIDQLKRGELLAPFIS